MLQKNSVYCGDSAKLMKEIPDNFIDLTITSPPYDSLRDYDSFSFDFYKIANDLYRITKDGGIVVWIVGDETIDFCETLTSFEQAIYFVREVGFKLLDTMIYAKKSYAPAYPNMKRYAQTFEYMFVLSKGKPKTFNPIKTFKEVRSIIKNEKVSTFRQKDGSTKPIRLKADSLKKSECNVWVYDVGFNKSSKDKISYEHPATFPEELAKDHILSWSNENELIFDPFAGSGTTLKMAKILNRDYLGFEISKKYTSIIKKRLGFKTVGEFKKENIVSKNNNFASQSANAEDIIHVNISFNLS